MLPLLFPVRISTHHRRALNPAEFDRSGERGDFTGLNGGKQRGLALALWTVGDVALAGAVRSHGLRDDSRWDRWPPIYCRFRDQRNASVRTVACGGLKTRARKFKHAYSVEMSRWQRAPRPPGTAKFWESPPPRHS